MSTLAKRIRGTHDLLPADYHAQHAVIATAEAEAVLSGFARMDTPLMEEARLFDRGLGASSDIVGKEMYRFATRGGEEVCLRPEGTASVVRAYFSHGLAQSTPLRYFYAGAMFRYERPQKGRLREFHQFGAELIGASGTLADLEIIALGSAILERLGVKDSVVLHLNTLGSMEDRADYRAALSDYFQASRGRLSEDSLRRLESNPLRILDSKAEQDRTLLEDAPRIDDFLAPESQVRFRALQQGLEDLGIAYQRDHHLVRGLDYYEHTAFEFITDALGAQGTVLGGGCYDRLFEIIGAKAACGVGFAAGIERLVALALLPPPPSPEVVLVPIGAEALGCTAQFAQVLRQAGIATVFGFSGSLKTRMRQANQSGATFAVLYGETELADEQVKLKDLRSGEESTVAIAALPEALLRALGKTGRS